MTETPIWGKKFQTRTKGANKELCFLLIHIANTWLININFFCVIDNRQDVYCASSPIPKN